MTDIVRCQGGALAIQAIILSRLTDPEIGITLSMTTGTTHGSITASLYVTSSKLREMAEMLVSTAEYIDGELYDELLVCRESAERRR